MLEPSSMTSLLFPKPPNSHQEPIKLQDKETDADQENVIGP